VVKYEGTGSARTVAHSLGTTVGMIIVKNLDQSDNWAVYHRGADASAPEDKYLILNLTSAAADDSAWWNDTAPTSSVFTVGTDHSVNASGENYIAYLFAHNNDDGGFGEPGDQDIIKCGSYTGNNSTTGPVIDLGFEPQWIFIKHIDAGAGGGESSFIFDNMRGVVTGGNDISLSPDAANDEQTSADSLEFNASGFQLKRANSSVNGNGNNYIYVAIRRGGMQTPTAASSVFAIDEGDSSGAPEYTSGFPVDMAIKRYSADTDNWRISARLIQGINHFTNTNSADDADDKFKFDFQNGYYNDSQGANNFAWMWARARGYFDVVTYTGTGGSSKTINHNLGVVPEMMWVKSRGEAKDWRVYHKGLDSSAPEDKYLKLNKTDAVADSTGTWNDTAPTSTQFTVGNSGDTNNAQPYIAYLFATAPNVSKLGSYTGTGSSQNIDCGFTAGSSFVLVKRYDGTDSWYIADSARGISSGQTDKIIKLNSTDAEFTESDNSADYIAPHASGFNVPASSPFNGNGDDFIFYAIAAIS